MAKPRVFVSSTYYDLRHIRDRLSSFIDSFGYESVLFENGDIPFRHDIPLDESCYAEVDQCHIFVLIIGNRYGSPTSDEKPSGKDELDKQYNFYNSITVKEYQSARNRDIPIFIFVDRNALSEYGTYKRNRDNQHIVYAHVDNVGVFKLMDSIYSQGRNNLVRGFDRFDDIAEWLRDQWAGLFADQLSNRREEPTLKDLATQLTELNQITNALKSYSESIIRQIKPEESGRIIAREEKRLRTGRLIRFSQEPFVKYLVETASSEHVTPPVSAVTLMTRLRRASDIKSFLISANFPQAFIDIFLTRFEDMAYRDFEQLKKRYDKPASVSHEVGSVTSGNNASHDDNSELANEFEEDEPADTNG